MLKTITKSAGFTDSERALAQLCNSTFLELWSYPSLWKPEGKKSEDGVGTELCDVLLVFGNTIVLFSDKDIKFHDDIDIGVAWKRWSKKAIGGSKKQLFGAMKWLKERPADIFLDARCKDPFPFIETHREYEFHLIAVTRNTAAAAARHFGLNSSGSLVQTSFDEYPAEPQPFVVQDDRSAHYVHVIDESSLRLVLQELDTAPDFIKYLKDKEHAVRRLRFRFIPGEEDFLGSYMLQGGPFVESPFRKLDASIPKDVAFFQMAEDGWAEYVNSGLRSERHQFIAGSYFWDELITRFCEAILGGYAPNPLEANSATHEVAVRRLASETRQSRVGLSKAYQEKVEQTPRNVRTSRIFQSASDKTRLTVLVLIPRTPDKTPEEHRELRLSIMQVYGLAAKVRFPKAIEITVIGTESGIGDSRSEDVLALHIPKLSEEELKTARQIMEEGNVLQDTWYEKASHGATPGATPYGMQRPTRRSFQKIGRNTPCPCASGKKYKHCCLGNEGRP